MRYFSEKTKEVITKKEQEVKYLRCDICNRKVESNSIDRYKESKYFRVCTHHHDWGNDSIDSFEYKDICPECIGKFCLEYLKEANGSEEIEISTEWFSPYYDEYDSFEDGLVKEDREGLE